MKKLLKQEVIPVLLGVDMNSYGMARSFHEEYGFKSLALGQSSFFHTQNTKILETKIISNLQDENVFLTELIKIARFFEGKKLFLLPTTEVYVEPIANNRAELEKFYIIPSIKADLLYELIRKDKFYELCDKYDIPTPKTILATYDDYKQINYDFEFGYPMVIKPNNSRTYFRTSFEGRKKAYIVESKEEAKQIVENIYTNSTYRDELLLQEFIPGDDENMRLISCYSDKTGLLKNLTITHVFLEDHAPSLIGNPVVHVIEYDEVLANKFRNLLNSLKFIGFSNVDLKYDARDGLIKAFDFNARLGRSSYHITASGQNIAKLIMDDYIYNKDIPLIYNKKEYLWTAVPLGIIYEYVSNPTLLEKAKRLIEESCYSRTLFYDKDMSLFRKFRLSKMDKAYFDNFKQNYIKR